MLKRKLGETEARQNLRQSINTYVCVCMFFSNRRDKNGSLETVLWKRNREQQKHNSLKLKPWELKFKLQCGCLKLKERVKLELRNSQKVQLRNPLALRETSELP